MKWKDDIEQRGDQREPGSDYVDEPPYSPLGEEGGKFGLKSLGQLNPVVLIAAGAAAVVILLLILFTPRGGDIDRQLEPLRAQLQGLEQRLAGVEGQEPVVAQLVEKGNAMDTLLARLDRFEAFANLRMDQITERLEKIENTPRTPPPAAAAPKKTAAAPAKKAVKTHTVKAGETLYGISRSYGLSVDQLMRMNGLAKGAVIQPGQRLTVSSGN
ncbi:MAG TPA: LysM domain-containing protein [Desulfobacterales bacterium]|nr:LysM domain-containing protein [Desulfobacterales bacterium]